MEHMASLFWLLTWPVLIYGMYKFCVFTVRLFERNNTGGDV
jgi:hypothetical protein